jgi:hypothetical protein
MGTYLLEGPQGNESNCYHLGDNMNERLKQIAIESKLIAPEYNGFDHTRLSISQQRFAELIVAEMLQTCEDHPAWTGRMIGEQIKQHFGVKE